DSKLFRLASENAEESNRTVPCAGMTTVLTSDAIDEVLARLQRTNADFIRANPGPSSARQPVHTVYGGAHLFRADSAGRLGELALRSLNEYAPDYCTFARAVGLRGSETLPSDPSQVRSLNERRGRDGDTLSDAARLANLVHQRIVEKLQREPVED